MKKFLLLTILLLSQITLKSTPVDENQVCDVVIEGPTQVCPGETNTYQITNLPPNAIVNFVAVGCCGAIGTFTYTSTTITLQIFETNPSISLCVDYTVGAINCTTCINIVAADEDEGNFTLSGPTSVCAGSEAVYQINPVPGPNVDITFSATNGTIISENGNLVTVLWDTESNSGELCLTYERNCGDDQVVCLEVDIIQPPNEAILTGLPDYACIGDSFEGNINPATFPSILWTASNASITSPNDAPEVEGNFPQSGLAEICVTLSVGCSNDATLCKSVTVSPAPNPTLDFTELCGLEGYLTAINTRPGSTFLWEQVSGPGNILFGDNTSITAGFNADEPGDYIISFTETLGNCQDIKTIKISLFPPLSVSQPEYICGPEGYKIAFTIDGGKPPVSVNGEEIFQSDYMSSVIPYGEPYNFRVEDSGLCLVDLNGEENCPCRNSAGTMRSFLLTGCDTASVTAVFDSTAVLLPGNVLRFVLHTSKSDTLGAIKSISRTPVFTFLKSMKFDTVYYISSIVADSIGSNIKLNDPCLQVSKGQPVVFYRTPVVNIIDPGVVCGNEVSMEAVADQKNSAWRWKDISNSTDSITFMHPDSSLTLITAVKTGTYPVVAEASNKGCMGRDTFWVSFNNRPEIMLNNIECNDSLLNYIITLDIKEGKAPYTLNQFTFSDTLYKTGNIASDTPYNIQLTDANGCLSNLLAGQPNCSCFSEAGTMSLDTLRICSNGNIAAGIGKNDSRRDINDTIAYILHDNPAGNPGYIYDMNFDGRFLFKEGFPQNQVLYISRVVGNKMSDTLDFNDPCLSVAPGQPVIFYPDPEPIISPDLVVCGTSLTVTLEIPGNQNFDLAAYDPSRLQISLNDTREVLFTGATAGTEVIKWSTFNPGCRLEGTWEIIFNPLPAFSQPLYDCLPSNDSVIVIFALPDPTGLIINNVLTFDFFNQTIPTSALPLALNLETDKGCKDIITLNYDCSCISVAGSMSQDTLHVCGNLDKVKAIYNNDGIWIGDTSIYILHTLSGNTAGDILVISDQGIFNYVSNAIFEKVYYISLVNYSKLFQSFKDDPCAVITPGQPVIFHALPSLSANITTRPCTPEADIEIFTDGQSSGWVVRSSPPGSSFFFGNNSLTGNTGGLYILELFAENKWCKNYSTTEVLLFDGPSLTKSQVVCEDTAFVVDLTWQGGSAPYTILNEVINGYSARSGRIPSGQTWRIEITDSRGCSTGVFSFTKECSCASFAGTIKNEAFIMCEGENLNLQVPEDAVLLPSQRIYYEVLARENGQDIILATSKDGTILYNPSWLEDTIFVRPVVALSDMDGNISRNDPCLTVGEVVFLTWKSKPNWTLADKWSVCPGDDVVIPINNTKGEELTLFYLLNSREDSIVITKASFDWNISTSGFNLPESIIITRGENKFCHRDTLINVMIESAQDWFASVKPEVIFTDTTNMMLVFETDLSSDDIAGIQWTFLSSGFTVSTLTPVLKLLGGQTGAVEIEITDTKGCRQKIQTYISLKETKGLYTFSNIIRIGSIDNGNFLVYPLSDIAIITDFSVYDRWGNKQFTSFNKLPEDFTWQGTCTGGPCPDGVYVFFLRLIDKYGEPRVFTGDITVTGQ